MRRWWVSRGERIVRGRRELCAYVYAKTKNVAFAQRAVRYLESLRADEFVPRRIEGAQALNPMEEVAGASTNTTEAQTSLTAIEILELCADQRCRMMQAVPAGGGRGRRGGDEGCVATRRRAGVKWGGGLPLLKYSS